MRGSHSMRTTLNLTKWSTLMVLFHSPVFLNASSPRPNIHHQKIVIGVDGGTESIRACCFDASNGQIIGSSYAVPYSTTHPQPGWAEQSPHEWYNNLGFAVRGALDSIAQNENEKDTVRNGVCAICIDTTCCSVVALDSNKEPLRPSLLWMDGRSAPQTREILEKCRGDGWLNINSNGEGPISAEWMIPKSLWIKQNEPEVWDAAETICEYQDYINYKLTGSMCASSCNAAARWHWNGEDCIREGNDNRSDEVKYPGRPISLYEKLGVPELADKLPKKCLSMGSLVGTLTEEAANHLSLPVGLPVAQGGPDAFVGMIGLGCIHPGQLCLITGSSHLHCVVTSHPTTAPGTWGAYPGAPLPGVNFAEGGQSSTGSIIRWAKKIFGGDHLEYKVLDDEASSVPPGSDGLVALETYQGSRTPVTDPLARGALVGLTLSHTRAHIWRALMEAVCYGTRSCIEGLAKAGHTCDEIVIAGGATRSRLWLQMHADVTGKPVVVCENTDAPLLGCAILASVGAGVHESVEEAVKAMVRTVERVEPEQSASAVYGELYDGVYSKLSASVRSVVHAIAELRGGGDAGGTSGKKNYGGVTKPPVWGLKRRGEKQRPDDIQASVVSPAAFVQGGEQKSKSGVRDDDDIREEYPLVSPSLLASDWSDIRSEISRCVSAGVPHLHVDVFDGVFLDSPYALTFGPQMVSAIRTCSLDGNNTKEGRKLVLDIHLCVDRPARYVKLMADAGADRFIFQWEAMAESDADKTRHDAALELARHVNSYGMRCGVSINPATNVEEVYPLLESGLVDLVDVLAVEPGFGGQTFQEKALAKLRKLRQWREERLTFVGEKVTDLKILVDGGINVDTAPRAIEAGADILVAGTFLFRHPLGVEAGVEELLPSGKN